MSSVTEHSSLIVRLETLGHKPSAINDALATRIGKQAAFSIVADITGWKDRISGGKRSAKRRAKLTEEDIRKIRVYTRPFLQIAAAYDVSYSLVREIKHLVAHRYVDGPSFIAPRNRERSASARLNLARAKARLSDNQVLA